MPRRIFPAYHPDECHGREDVSLSEPYRDQSFPRGALIGAAGLIGFALLVVSLARITGLGDYKEPPPPTVTTLELRFEDRADGAILVYEGRTDRVVDLVSPGTGGFIRGVLRALARERRGQGDQEESTPFLLRRHVDGRVTLEDTATGRLIDLKAFGPTNQEAFARWLDLGKPAS